jgi:hypothetical protein
MSAELWIAVAGNVTTLLVAAGGWLFTWRLQTEKKKQERRDKLLMRCLSEIQARIALEEEALKFMASNWGVSMHKTKILLRDRVKGRLEHRPEMTRIEVNKYIKRYGQ